MHRVTGTYLISSTLGEPVRAFLPYCLPPTDPALSPASYDTLNRQAELALARLSGVAGLVPALGWLSYGPVRKEALLTSQIEGTQATLIDLIDDEAGFTVSNADDVQEVYQRPSAMRCPPLVTGWCTRCRQSAGRTAPFAKLDWRYPSG